MALATPEGKIKHAFWLALAALLAISAAPAAELLRNGSFKASAKGWWGTDNLVLKVRDGRLCASVPGGTANPWDAIVGTSDIRLVEGETYGLAFSALGDPGGPVRALVQMPVEPYTAYLELTRQATPAPEDTAKTFTAPVSLRHAQLQFQLGGSATPWRFCLDNVSLKSGVEVPAYRPDTGPRVRVNQLGYLPDGPKRATLVTEKPEPLAFTVSDASGSTVFTGTSTPRGVDPSAGLAVQTLDFSALAATGEGFTVSTDGETSYPFAVRADLYASLLHDAFSYYYPVRSGIAIEDAIAGAGYGRPAGHLSRPGAGDINQGDLAVPCRPAYPCDYTLEVTGGWYDAGDHGKYVVNGGIAVAQMMAAYNRDQRTGGARLGEGSLALPEAGDGVPDALDEAGWELEWLLKMVVPDGEPLAGMVHHAVADAAATGIPLLPSDDPMLRELDCPSTAATLDLAAAAAQGARLYGAYDKDFASRLLAAARTSYAAAKAHPVVLVPAEGADAAGSVYPDGDVSDEFYWAAAELFITTGEAAYLADLKASPLWREGGFRIDSFDWARVGGFAQLELATHAAALPSDDAATVTRSVLAAADRLLAIETNEPFGQSYSPEGGRYEWGSNHAMLNNATVLATAFDLSGDRRYRAAALEAVDYIFGRNALNQSYVTGYGTTFSQQQHSRWFAHAANPDFPPPPNGALAGGPNSSIQDPVVQGLFGNTGCAPQLCYVDDIGAWSVNEITINWNAALGQMAEWLASQ